jgi:hypothetical protein
MLFSILWYHTVRTLLLGQFAAIEPFLHQWRNFDGVTVMVYDFSSAPRQCL